MTLSVDIQVAEAIKDAIEAATLETTPDNVIRAYADVAKTLEDLDESFVHVVPWDLRPELASRSQLRYEVVTDILIRKRFSAAENGADGKVPNATVDEMPRMREQILELLVPSQPNQTGTLCSGAARFEEVQVVSPMIRKHWTDQRQFTAWLRFTHIWTKAPG